MPDAITDDEPESGRILLMDQVYQWGVSDRYTYNHGPGGSGSVHKTGYDLNSSLTPDFEGTNVAFGDGAVRWFARSSWDVYTINQSQYGSSASGYASGGGNKDLSFFPDPR